MPASPSRDIARRWWPLLETFAFNELRRQLAWSRVGAAAHHFRDRDGAEVDMVFEARDGRVVAVEVKASATVDRRDFRWLELLRAKADDDFVHGFVLYCGDRPLAFGDRLSALPLSYLWEPS